MDRTAMLEGFDRLAAGRSMLSGLADLLCHCSGPVDAEGLAALVNPAEQAIKDAEAQLYACYRAGSA